MSVYLLNLGFSPSSSGNGNFDPFSGSSTGLNQSCAWYQYGGSGISLNDDFYLLNQNLNASDWTSLGSDANALSVETGDYFLVRVFASGSMGPNYRVRFSAIFGRGSPNALSTSISLQSPLQLVQSGNATARPVADSEVTAASGWPVSPTSNNVWTYCLGMIYGQDNTYGVSVGVSVLNPGTQLLALYGHDPTMKVGGG